MKTAAKLWIGIAILIVLVPLGLLLPEHFKAGAAWGEWSVQEIGKLVGYVPQGFEKLSGLWTAPLSDYAFKGWEEKGLPHLSLAYIISAMVGIAVTIVIVFGICKLLTKKEDR